VPDEVVTERLLLRQWRDSDLDAFAEMMADPAVTRYLSNSATADRDESWRHMAVLAGAWPLRGFSHWALELRSTGEFVGRAGPWFPEGWPSLEIGWAIAPRHQGRGYATEAGRVALRVARENIGADRVISLIRPGNEPSVAVAVKLGGVLDSTIEFRGGPTLVYAYPSRLQAATRWPAAPARAAVRNPAG
jgi:RimJ/RimL family protein N-acetyltransferase